MFQCYKTAAKYIASFQYYSLLLLLNYEVKRFSNVYFCTIYKCILNLNSNYCFIVLVN